MKGRTLQERLLNQLRISNGTAANLAALVSDSESKVANCLRNMERAEEVRSFEIPGYGGGVLTIYRVINQKLEATS